jgi:hypothetical protein
MVGFFPDTIILIAASLSSRKRTVSFLPRSFSQRVMAGKASTLTPWSAATISASGVLWETQLWRLLTADSGTNVAGPLRHKNTPVVERFVSASPAKSASV